ncbi:MAG: AraC family transcriptional regulator [Kiritimatiellales bacterium]
MLYSAQSNPLIGAQFHVTRYGVHNPDISWYADPYLETDNKLYFIKSGEGRYNIDGVSVKLTPGYIYLFPGDSYHSFSTGTTVEIHWVHFQCLTADGINLCRQFKIQKRRPVSQIPDIEDKLQRIHKAYDGFLSRDNAGKFMESIGTLMTILSVFICPGSTLLDKKEITNLNKAIRFINDQIPGPIRIDDLARISGLERTYFSTLFKRTIGCSPKEFLNRRRIQHVLPLLKDPYIQIGEIAEHAGFDDPYYFSRFFKNNTGMSPTMYRQHLCSTAP